MKCTEEEEKNTIASKFEEYESISKCKKYLNVAQSSIKAYI